MLGRITVFICFISAMLHASISGRVVDQNGSSLSGVRVEQLNSECFTTTSSRGTFTLDCEGTVLAKKGEIPRSSYSFSNQSIMLSLNKASKISIELFDLSGKKAVSMHRELEVGSHNLPLFPQINLSANRYVLSLKINDQQESFYIQYDSEERQFHANTSLRKAGKELVDLLLTKDGYSSLRLSVMDGSNTGELTLNATENIGNFNLVFEGSGLITDLQSGTEIFVPFEDRVHVILLSEGYTSSDINLFDDHIDSWMSAVFNFEPLISMKESFVIWKYPIESESHVYESGNTAFGIEVSSSGIIGYSSAPAPLWNILDDEFPYLPTEETSKGDLRNLVVQFFVLRNTGTNSYSGWTASFYDNTRSRKVKAAMGSNQQHEFMHALAHLQDEYYDVDQTPYSPVSQYTASNISNVSSSNQCHELPWSHLLYGGSHNPGVDSLVGAFGTNSRYHPELRCLMNGSHDNGLLFGGSNNLRNYEGLCNWCQELTAFRIFERLGLLTGDSWNTWINEYRDNFWNTFPFTVPTPTPQENNDGTPVFHQCI
jgi:hypothetical protein